MAECGYNVIFLDIDSVCNHSKPAETAYDDYYSSPWFIAEGVPLCRDNLLALKSVIERIENPAVDVKRRGSFSFWKEKEPKENHANCLE